MPSSQNFSIQQRTQRSRSILATIHDADSEEPPRKSHRCITAEKKKVCDDSEHRTSSNDDDPALLNKLEVLYAERATINTSIRHLDSEIEIALESRPCESSTKQLSERLEALHKDVIMLEHELEIYHDVDPHVMIKKEGEIVAMKAEAGRWTDNIEILEGWVCRVFGINDQQIESLRRECYGPEYVEGEALREP